jgi:hypothetical protein
VTAQHADDQFRLCAAGYDRHRYCCAVQDLNSSALVHCPTGAATDIMVALRADPPVAVASEAGVWWLMA